MHEQNFYVIVKNFCYNLLTFHSTSLSEQQKIASILSAFDDKIELNNEMNKTLEEIAQAIFKHWFIDFEFPNENGEPYKSSGGEFVDSELGPIPKGWKVKSIGELVDFTISGDWGNDERSQDYDKKCFCIRGADFPPILRGDKTNIPVRFLKRSSFEKRRLKHGDILIEVSGGTKGRPTGRTVFVHRNLIKQFDESLVFSNFCRLIRVNNMLNSIILFLYLQFIYNKGKMTQYEIQSTGISNFQLKYFFENEKLAVAPIEIQEKFINLVEPIFDKKYTFENYYLSQLRDTLLPKLISGEIRVM
ncbi:restriction endonuclease subunit S [Thermovorax subterraneus]|nr:restriction endonuclease subunit S [Thermovorax subterraneus]